MMDFPDVATQGGLVWKTPLPAENAGVCKFLAGSPVRSGLCDQDITMVIDVMVDQRISCHDPVFVTPQASVVLKWEYHSMTVIAADVLFLHGQQRVGDGLSLNVDIDNVDIANVCVGAEMLVYQVC
jgi:hypothetical protein